MTGAVLCVRASIDQNVVAQCVRSTWVLYHSVASVLRIIKTRISSLDSKALLTLPAYINFIYNYHAFFKS